MLLASFVALFAINILQARIGRVGRIGRGAR
jgi:hypothetical protein